MKRRELEAQLLDKISEVIPIIRRNNDIKNLQKAVFSSLRGNGLIIAMDFSEKQKLDAPVKYLLGLKETGGKYSEKYIKNMLLDCYTTLLIDENKLNDNVKEIVNKMLANESREYLIISELENIEIVDDQEYEFIESTIKTINKEDIPFNPDIIRMPGTGILNKPAIITKVRAGEDEKAKEIALHRFLVSLNLLRLFVPSNKPALKGALCSTIRRLLINDGTNKSVSAVIERLGDSPLKKVKLSSEVFNQMLESGIGELRKESEISKVVKECLYWYGLGLEERYPAARLINFVTVLESALKKKSENTELRRTVSERGAILLNDNYEDRKKALEDLKEIYDLRSKVVHTGALIENKDLASLAGGYARAVLLTLIEKSKAFNGNFERFINHIDDIKLGKAENI